MKHPIPAEALSQHIAILGKTGSGKTSTEKFIVEGVASDEYRVCVLDTIKSDWWGITSSSDGKRPGLPFKILGGPRGHVPLPSSAGKVIGQLVGTGKLPLSIIDMADFEPGGIQRFFVDFAPSLMRNMRGVVYLVIEEAHELAPKERAGFNAENMAIHWAKKLATAGRSKGIRLIVATQRVQSLHNAVLGSCETVIAHRLTTPADQKPILDWLKANASGAVMEMVSAQLASLKTGAAWVCSGEAQFFSRVEFPKFKTYDNTATPTGDGGDIEVQTAPVDHDELASLIGEEVKKAEADDPKALRKRIAQLEAEAKKAPTLETINIGTMIDAVAAKGYHVYDPSEFEKVRREVFDEASKLGIAQANASSAALAATMLRPFVDQTRSLAEQLGACLLNIQGAIDKAKIHVPIPSQSGSPRSIPAVGRTHPSARINLPRATSSPVVGGDGTKSGPVQRILNSLAFWVAVGEGAPSRSQVAFVAGYSPKSSGFEKALSNAKTAGLIHYPTGGLVEITSAGAASARELTQAEAAAAIRSVLSQPQLRVALALIVNGRLTREALAEQTEYSDKSSGFEKVLSQLNTLNIVTYPSKGHVQITDWAAELLA